MYNSRFTKVVFFHFYLSWFLITMGWKCSPKITGQSCWNRYTCLIIWVRWMFTCLTSFSQHDLKLALNQLYLIKSFANYSWPIGRQLCDFVVCTWCINRPVPGDKHRRGVLQSLTRWKQCFLVQFWPFKSCVLPRPQHKVFNDYRTLLL